jgi:hypothetical protein
MFSVHLADMPIFTLAGIAIGSTLPEIMQEEEMSYARCRRFSPEATESLPRSCFGVHASF